MKFNIIYYHLLLHIIKLGRQTLSRDVVLKMPTQYAVLPYTIITEDVFLKKKK